MFSLLMKGHEVSPLWLKRLYGAIPWSVRMGAPYRRMRHLLAESQWWSADLLGEYQLERLKAILRHAYAHVPYYRKTLDELGICPKDIQRLEDIHKLPLISKEQIRARFEEFRASGSSRRRAFYTTTGGTTGQFGFYLSDELYPIEWAFMVTLWERVGYRPGDRKATLRGIALGGQKWWGYRPVYNELLLSPFHMSEDHLPAYVDKMREFQPKFIHGYPSAVTLLARYVERVGLNGFAPIQAVLAASENILPGQRELIEGVLQTRFFSWYGHSERLILAGECECSTDYHVFPEYGLLEIVRHDGTVITAPGEVGELVGTTFYNYAMPFIRYRTGDVGAYVEGECACGRVYQRITRVEGRWFQDMLVGKHGELISMAAINVHSSAFDHVVRFQYYQDSPGAAELRIVPGPEYSEENSRLLLRELYKRVGDTLEIKVVLVDQVELTPIGKLKLLVQKLPVELLPAESPPMP